MLTAIQQHTTVKKGGIIEISAPDLPEGAEVDVSAVVSSEVIEERDDTSYLLSNPATRERLLRSIRNVELGVNLVEVKIEGEE